uniref:Uncharacterized protein n=1 Tax=Rhizophora mucronata TaxID=61149 RepID=A0A2P2MZ23_RHIMU
MATEKSAEISFDHKF